MVEVTSAEAIVRGHAAMAEGQWGSARASFEVALEDSETGDAYFGLAVALWWSSVRAIL